ncbi:sugar transferase [bacterium]|nr:sugar transferase [bacterium]
MNRRIFKGMTGQIEDGITASFSEFSFSPSVRVRNSRSDRWIIFIQQILKRTIDIFLSLVFILISLPLMILISVAIKLTSKGPIFFTQKRVGYQGNQFKIIKFRTMRPENKQEEHHEYIQNLLKEDYHLDQNKVITDYFDYIDRRTTKIGNFLRATSLDELPQLLNILLGNMSLVGPRPHPVYEVKEYKDWYKRRLHVKPGLTGWSKLNLRLTPQNYEESILYDLWYVDNWSNRLDIKILLMTVPFVLSMKDAH